MRFDKKIVIISNIMNFIADCFRLLILLKINTKTMKGIINSKISLMLRLIEYKKFFISIGTKLPKNATEIMMLSKVNNCSIFF